MSTRTMSSYPGFHVRRRHPAVVVDIGCGCHRKPKLFSLLNFSRATTTKKKSSSSSSCSTYSTNATITNNSTFSPCKNDDSTASSSSSSASPTLIKKSKSKSKKKKKKKKKGVVEQSSVAVEKESLDPYVDFKESMVQMIVEKGMHEWEELRELLDLFLSLNSPYHHHLILRAFTEVWEGLPL